MRKDSKYYPLQHVVMCMPPNQRWFEPIAAFNDHSVAKDYARQCAAAHDPDWRYQVWSRDGKKGWNIGHTI